MDKGGITNRLCSCSIGGARLVEGWVRGPAVSQSLNKDDLNSPLFIPYLIWYIYGYSTLLCNSKFTSCNKQFSYYSTQYRATSSFLDQLSIFFQKRLFFIIILYIVNREGPANNLTVEDGHL